MTSSRTRQHVVHNFKSYTTTSSTRHLVAHDIASHTTSRRTWHPDDKLYPNLYASSVIFFRRRQCHNFCRTRHFHAYMSSPESSQIKLDLPNDVILDPSLHVESSSRVNYDVPLYCEFGFGFRIAHIQWPCRVKVNHAPYTTISPCRVRLESSL